jgi:hypothetical protein
VALPLSLLDEFAKKGMYPAGSEPTGGCRSVVVSVPPSYNNAYPTSRSGRRFLSDDGKAWYELNLKVLAELEKPERYPVVLVYTIREWVNPRRDGSGLEKLIADGCVKAGVFVDDSLPYISGEDWRYRPCEGGVGVEVSWYYDPDPPKERPKKPKNTKQRKKK